MYANRVALYESLEASRESAVITYITGTRPGMETQIANDAVSIITDHLDAIGVQKRISLFLYTHGGETLAARSLVNIIRQFCDDFEVIVPMKALSAGTLICLGADRIIMTKQATLGPIDPSINTALNPHVPWIGPQATVPVSVEAIKGYIDLAKRELGIDGSNNLTEVLSKLTEHVHPLVLGQMYRSKTQIQMIAERFLSANMTDPEKIARTVSFLCSDSGSHDYTITRREARDSLGLNIETPSPELYATIRDIYKDIREELELDQPYNANLLLGSNQEYQYNLHRGIIESKLGGAYVFASAGILRRMMVQPNPMEPPQQVINDQRLSEGWRRV